MKPWKPKILGALLALACLGIPQPLGATVHTGLAGPPSKVPAGEPPHPARLALLVGIDRYAVDDRALVPTLSGAVADVRRARKVLVERLGFDPEEVLVLENEQATHEGIVRAFDRHLIARAGPDTEVVYWFSGHGSRVPDRSGATAVEQDGLDSSFIAHDSRSGGRVGEHDLVDDELGSLLRVLTARTSRVLVVLDTCHAGGGMRSSSSAGARLVSAGQLPLDSRSLEGFWPAGVPLAEDHGWPSLDPKRYTCLAASWPDELAYEVSVGEGTGAAVQGLMSYFLLEELARATPGTTLRSIAERTRLRVGQQRADQTVWFSGALDRALLDGRFTPPSVGHETNTSIGDELRVEAGRFHLLRRGSVLSVRDDSGEELGLARVVHAGPTQSRAHWLAPGPLVDPPESMRAVEVGRPTDSEPLAVFTPDPELRIALAASDLATPAAIREGSYLLARDPRTEELLLYDAEHVPAGPSSKRSGGTGDLDVLLRAELRWRELFDLGLEVGNLDVGLSVRSPSPEECARYGGRRPVSFGTEFGGGDRRAMLAPDEDHLFVLRIENRSDRPIHASIFDVSEDRSTVELYRTEQALGPGQDKEHEAVLVLPRGWPLERAMRDRILLIATTRPVDLSSLESETTLRGYTQPQVLERILKAGATRGSDASSADAWGLACLELRLEPSVAPLSDGKDSD